jgi:sulfur carrier protein
MTLEINGEVRVIPPVSNLLELLAYLETGQDRIAVEINQQIIRRKDWETTPVQELDRVEIVQFVGGG